MASAGVPGATILSPTVLVKYASLLWLWYRAPCTPPPYGMRITIGTPKVPFDRYRMRLISDTIWLKAGYTKSANCISAMGRRP